MHAHPVIAHQGQVFGFRRMAQNDFVTAQTLDLGVMRQRARDLDTADIFKFSDTGGERRRQTHAGKRCIEHPHADLDLRHHRLEPFVDRLLAGDRIVGINDDGEISANLLGVARQIDSFVWRMMSGVGDDLAFAARLLDNNFNHALALFLGQRPELAHGAGTENTGHAEGVGKVAHVMTQAGLVERTIGRKRRGDRRPDPAKLGASGFLGFRFTIIQGDSPQDVLLSKCKAGGGGLSIFVLHNSAGEFG